MKISCMKWFNKQNLKSCFYNYQINEMNRDNVFQNGNYYYLTLALKIYKLEYPNLICKLSFAEIDIKYLCIFQLLISRIMK